MSVQASIPNLAFVFSHHHFNGAQEKALGTFFRCFQELEQNHFSKHSPLE